MEAARRHLAPVVQLLQWLQCFSSLDSDDLEALVGTLQQLKRLSPQQLIYAAKNYRLEVGEKGLPKSAMKYLDAIRKEAALRKDRRKTASSMPSVPSTPIRSTHNGNNAETPGSITGTPNPDQDDDDDIPDGINLDPSLMLPFTLPTVTDMLISYGAGFGGVNRERERKYIPTIPPEYLDKLEVSSNPSRPIFGEKDWENEEV
ncbi:hypothetical protein PC116_g30079 [Phytophthora cactorum]|nr:hypothetical protein PC116_g30079 [Phytophthora cactorum]